MRVPEEPVCIHLFRRNPVFTSLHFKSPVHVVPPLMVGRSQGVLDVAETAKITGGGGGVSAGVSGAGGGGAGGHRWPILVLLILAVSLGLLSQLTAVTSCWE
jgi:hypothetical protein